MVFFATTQRLEKLEEKSKIYNGLILSHEISSLYIRYFVKPVLSRFLGNPSWDNFTNRLQQLEDDIDDARLKAIDSGNTINDEKLYRPITKFLEPLQNEIAVSLTDIRFLKKDRVGIAHIRHRTVPEQLSLIDQMKKSEFPERFEHKELVKDMVAALEKHKAHFHYCH